MLDKKNRIRLISVLFILFVFIFQTLFIIQINTSNNYPNNFLNSTEVEKNVNIRPSAEESYTEQWLGNPTFDSPIEPWFLLEEGDLSDVQATTSQNQGNLGVLGEAREFSLVVDPSNAIELAKWETFKKSEFDLYPHSHGINSSGFYTSHFWKESGGGQDENTPAVRWKRNITMDVEMSDYIITSASIEAQFNATVQAKTLTNGGIEVPNDYTSDEMGGSQNDTLDHARFSVEISNLECTKKFELAHNQTRYLGDDDVIGTWDSLPDTPMTNNVDEEVLIAYLTSILDDDPFHKSFTIILGIDIYCADNYFSSDQDNWQSLIIRYLNLTFTYEKKIDQLTTVSWNQIGDKLNDRISDIPNATIDVKNATLNFRHKIDQTWSSSSPNSEIRIKIGNNKHTETIKLSSASTSFQEAKSGGFDVTSLILKDVNLSLSIQVFLADEFGLDRNITISIDDVYLYISYIIFTPDTPLEPGPDLSWLIYLLIIAIIALITIFTLYQLHFKYPPMVRKTRKLRKKIRKGKRAKPILIHKREDIVKNHVQNLLQILKVEPKQPEIIDKGEKISQKVKIKQLQKEEK